MGISLMNGLNVDLSQFYVKNQDIWITKAMPQLILNRIDTTLAGRISWQTNGYEHWLLENSITDESALIILGLDTNKAWVFDQELGALQYWDGSDYHTIWHSGILNPADYLPIHGKADAAINADLATNATNAALAADSTKWNNKDMPADTTGYLKNTAGALSWTTLTESDITNLVNDLAAKLPLAGGTMTGNVLFSNTKALQFNSATQAAINSPGLDGADFTNHNLRLSSWYGIGFFNSCNAGTYPSQCSIVMNVRDGIVNAKGGFQVNGATYPYGMGTTAFGSTWRNDVLTPNQTLTLSIPLGATYTHGFLLSGGNNGSFSGFLTTANGSYFNWNGTNGVYQFVGDSYGNPWFSSGNNIHFKSAWLEGTNLRVKLYNTQASNQTLNANFYWWLYP